VFVTGDAAERNLPGTKTKTGETVRASMGLLKGGVCALARQETGKKRKRRT